MTHPSITVDCVGQIETHGQHEPRRIVLHDTESHDCKGIRDLTGIVAFWKRQALGYGAHVIVDAQGNSARCALPRSITWHVGGHNTGSLGIEQTGFARFLPKVWRRRPKQLQAVAVWLAFWSEQYGIPLIHSTDHGVCTHADFHGGHTDPGRGYPLAHVLALAREQYHYNMKDTRA
jgi:hypothetical protein